MVDVAWDKVGTACSASAMRRYRPRLRIAFKFVAGRRGGIGRAGSHMTTFRKNPSKLISSIRVESDCKTAPRRCSFHRI